MSQPHHPQSEPPTLGEHNGYPIYPMPAFVTLTASDLEATVAFFTEALDFGVMFSGPEVNGTPMLVHCAAHATRTSSSDRVPPERRQMR